MAIAKRKLAEPVRIDIKKEDTVKVITGRDKGKQGRVLSVNRDTGKVLVEHVMMIKRHTRKNQQNPQGAIVEREGSIHISNVMLASKYDERAARRGSAEPAAAS